MPKLYHYLLKDLIPIENRFLEEVTAIANEALRLMEEYELNSKQSKGKRGRKKKNTDDSIATIASHRPPRTARNVAKSRIEKQSNINLIQKLRRPDTNESPSKLLEIISFEKPSVKTTPSPRRSSVILDTPQTLKRNNVVENENDDDDVVPDSSTDETPRREKSPVFTSGRRTTICNDSRRSTRASKRNSIILRKEEDGEVISEPEPKKLREDSKGLLNRITETVPELEIEKTEAKEHCGVEIEVEMAEEVVEDENANRDSQTMNLSPSFSRPNAESSTIISPKANSCNGTFLVPRKPLAVCNPEPGETTFVVPQDKSVSVTPVAYSKRTKPVVNSKYFDNAGNPLPSTSMKDEGELIDNLSPINSTRTTQTKTVRKSKSGINEPNPALKTSEIENDCIRMTRTKTRAMQQAAESVDNNQQMKQKSVLKKVPPSTAKKNALLVAKLANSANRFKTPLSMSVKKMNSAQKMFISHSAIKRMEHATVVKTADNDAEIQIKLREKALKEEQAKLKKVEELNKIKEGLKRKNNEKLNRALKCRERLEVEKQEQKLQSEKEREEKRIQLFKEREEKKKKEIEMKKLRQNQKLAENEERRRKEEAARLAKIRELELEHQKLQEIKQQQLEQEERRVKERLEEKRKQEQVNEFKMKKAAQEAESQKSKNMKKMKFKYDLSKYKPRSDDDYGLHNEYSDMSDDEDDDDMNDSAPQPLWVKELKENRQAFELSSVIPKEIFSEFMTSGSMTPNVQVWFKMTPTRPLKRTSSAIWTATPN